MDRGEAVDVILWI